MSWPGLSKFSGWIRKNSAHNNLFLWGALLTACLASLPLWLDPGFLNTRGGGDSPFLLQRLHQLTTALLDGHFPVRWMPDANYGYGYPFYNYYAPLSIYSAAAFRIFGISYVSSIQLSQLAGFLAAAWAMFQLAKRWTGSPWVGWLASAAYTLAPFHMVNVYVRGDSLAEFWAMAMYPLLLLGLDNLFNPHYLIKNRRNKGIVLLALAFAGLLLSHNISALIFTPFVILFFITAILVKDGWQADTPNNQDVNAVHNGDSLETDAHSPDKSRQLPGGSLFYSFAAIVLGLILAAWFWVPALAESSSAQLKPVTAGYFHFSNHFRGSDLVQPSFIFDYNVAGGGAFSAGLLQSLLILAGLTTLFFSRYGPSKKSVPISKRVLVFVTSGLIISTFMISPLSQPLWEYLPLLSFAQFPWRFLSVQAFFGALAVGGLGLLPGKRVIVPILIVLLLITTLAGLKLDFIRLNDDDVTASGLAKYEWFTGNIGTTVSAEYLPESVVPRPFTSGWLNTGERGKIQVIDGVVAPPLLIERSTALHRWDLEVLSPIAVITLPTIDWPGWTAKDNGRDINISPAPGSGLISAQLPRGFHELELRLRPTPVRLAAEILSLIGLAVAAVFAFPSIRGWKPGYMTFILITAFVGGAVLFRLLPDKELMPDDLNWDFDQLAYLNHANDGLRFDDGSFLNNYSYTVDRVHPGDKVSITLEWEELRGKEVVMELLSPAANRYPDAPPIVSQVNSDGELVMSFDLAIPPNSPAGLFLPAVTLPGASSLTSSGNARGKLYLRPLLITDIPQPARRLDSALAVRVEKAAQRKNDLLDLQLQWLTTSELTQNYNFSLRLTDRQGTELVQFDNQPGYGYQPSSGWEVGMWVDDWLTMPLPEDLTQDKSQAPYSLVARLYDLSTGEEVLITHLGLLDWHGGVLRFDSVGPSGELPGQLIAASALINDEIQLLGYTQETEGPILKLTLYWQAVRSGLENYYRFVHLVDPSSSEIILQDDTLPRSNTYPTTQWPLGTIVEDPVILDISDLGSGEFQLFTGFFRRQDDLTIALDAYNDDGQLLPDGRVPLSEPLFIRP